MLNSTQSRLEWITLAIFLFYICGFDITFAQNTIYVPGDQPTIQAGIAVASDGDIVLVADGTYIENINFSGKGITVASHFLIDGNKSHIENTIIDGSSPTNPNLASVVSIWSGEDSTSILCGFTITGGIGSGWSSYERAGGGIYIYNSSPIIRNNIIENNNTIAAGNVGGSAILVEPHFNSTAIIENNIIRNNIAQSTGSNTSINGTILIRAVTSTLIIRNNIIADNTLLPESDNLYCNGGGISTFGYDLPGFLCIIENNIIRNNTVNPEGQNPIAGGLHLNAINAVVRNNIIAFNSAKAYGGIHYTNTIGNNVSPEIVNNLIIGNVATSTCGGISTHYPYVIQNCIIWGNSSPQYYGTIATIDYSNLEESYSNGSHNISLNPEFMDTTYFLLSDTSPCIDMGNPDPMFNDIEDPTNPGFALSPAQGTFRNDIGQFGGPHSNWHKWEWPLYYLPSKPVLISPSDTVNTSEYSFIWTKCSPLVTKYWFEIDTSDQFTSSLFIDSLVTDTTYLYTDLISEKNYWWRVRAYNDFGWGAFSDVGSFSVTIVSVDDENGLSKEFSLEQNYPNPFNPNTKIKYSIPASLNPSKGETLVTLKIYDFLGCEIETLINEQKPAGTYELTWYAENLPSGVYFYQIKADTYVETKKMILLK